MISAGIGDDAARSLFRRQRRDFVVGAAQLESSNRLQILGLQKECSVVGGGAALVDEDGISCVRTATPWRRACASRISWRETTLVVALGYSLRLSLSSRAAHVWRARNRGEPRGVLCETINRVFGSLPRQTALLLAKSSVLLLTS